MTILEELQYKLIRTNICKELVLCESFSDYLELWIQSKNINENVSKTTQTRKRIVKLLSTENTLRQLIKNTDNPEQLKQFKRSLKFCQQLREKEKEKLRKELDNEK